MRKLNLIASLLFLIFTSSVFAQTSPNTSRSITENYATTRSDEGFLPSLGVAFGHFDQSGNSDEDGDGVTLQAIGTYNFANSNWAADGGLGVHKQYFTGIDETPVLGLVTIAGRYQFPGRWSIGPAADLLIGDADAFGTDDDFISMIGAVGLKEIVFQNDQLVRLGLKFSSEFGASDQTSNYLGFVAQWGIGSASPLVRDVTSLND